MASTIAFADPSVVPSDFSSFSKQQIDADSGVHGFKGLTAIPPLPPGRTTDAMELAGVIGAAAAGKIEKSDKKIVFNVIGDSGGIHHPEFQLAVANAMDSEPQAHGASLCYHVGDVVYYFGQEQYYYEQFYDVYRNYNAPIFAIPGNHDGVTFANEAAKSLEAFIRNFCSAAPEHNPDALGAVRTTMAQPWVYFTLNAPFVKFIGLYSNTSESYQEGAIAGPQLGDAQLKFLQKHLQQAKAERDAGKGRALVIATHHPPFTASPDHVPSEGMLNMIDQACQDSGILPDMHISGHSHLYERYTRTLQGHEIPYVVAGMSGYYNLAGLKARAKPNAIKPAKGKDASGNPLSLDYYTDTVFGYVRFTASASSIFGEFIGVDTQSGKTKVADSFTLDLKTSQVTGGKAGKGGKKPHK